MQGRNVIVYIPNTQKSIRNSSQIESTPKEGIFVLHDIVLHYIHYTWPKHNK